MKEINKKPHKKDIEMEVQRAYNASEIIELEAKVDRLRKELYYMKQRKVKPIVINNKYGSEKVVRLGLV